MSLPQPTKPTSEEIEILRDLFFKKIEKDDVPCEGGFHPKDLEKAKTCNRWLELFLEQTDCDMKQALKMLWETCIWRKAYGTNDICEDNIRMDYMKLGLIFPHNKDKDGKTLLIFKTKLHQKGSRDVDDLIRILVYWIERLHREQNYNQISILFDMQATGIGNMDMDFTKRIIDTFKSYYPNSLNYIIIFEMPWILSAAFKVIKSLLPPKAVARMKFVNTKTMNEVISHENMLTCWGGSDNYTFIFEPGNKTETRNQVNNTSEKDTTVNGNLEQPSMMNSATARKVHFANASPPASPMSDISTTTLADRSDVEWLRITPDESIVFEKNGTELIGMVDILNVTTINIIYKIKTTSPEKFRVRPSTGYLTPGKSTTINVVLQQGLVPHNKDKFLVMCMTIPDDGTPSVQEIADIWKNTPSTSPLIEQHRLRCTLPQAAPGDSIKNGRVNSNGYGDTDRQISHFSSSICQLTETTQSLENQLKMTQTIQWITLAIIILLSIIIVYMLKQEINSTELCKISHPSIDDVVTSQLRNSEL